MEPRAQTHHGRQVSFWECIGVGLSMLLLLLPAAGACARPEHRFDPSPLTPCAKPKTGSPRSEPVTLERLLRAQAAVAYLMARDGPVYAPYFERLEREIAARRAADDVMARAKRFLDEVKPPLSLTHQSTC
jgi:hypothetical protein